MILNTEIWNNLHDIFNSLDHHPQFCATVLHIQQQATDTDGISPALKRFKLLSARASTEISTSVAGSETPQIQLTKYISQLEEGSSHLSVMQNDPLSFWSQQASSFPFIADLAVDLLAASASQAFVERIFSVCGMHTQGRCNRMTRSLEMRVCLKLNIRVLSQAQTDVWHHTTLTCLQ